MKTENRLFLFTLLLLLIGFAALGYFCHPSADDFEDAAAVLKEGFWNCYFKRFLLWNGRYINNLFTFTTPLRWHSIAGYKVVPAALMTLSYFSAYFFLSPLVKNRAHVFAAAYLLLYLTLAPSLPETFYWYPSAISYQLTCCLSLIYFALLYRFFAGGGSPGYFRIFLLIVMAGIIMGFDEVNMLLMIAIHAVFIAFNLRSKSAFLKVSRILFLFVLLFSSVHIFSPGNALRAAQFDGPHQFFHSVYWSSLQTVRFFLIWSCKAPLILASLLFIPLVKELEGHSEFFRNKFFIPPLITISALPVSVFLSVFPAYWGMGILGQYRTVNVACFFFIPLWFMNLYLLVNAVSGMKSETGRQFNAYAVAIRKFRIPFAFVFISSFFLSGNGRGAYGDLFSGRAAEYDRQLYQRYRAIGEAVSCGKKETEVENLKAKPKSICLYDISCDPDFWINKCVADYFKIERIRLKTCE